jgi:hypothetical protein
MLELPDDGMASIAIVGAIGPDKGARRLEQLVALARELDAPVRFVLIGYMDVRQQPWQAADARFTVHGRYETADLPRLFAHYRAALVLYPSAGPETFSYTLSEAWSAGIPVLVPPIGALAERVAETGAGFVMTDAEWRDERAMLERVRALTAPPPSAAAAALRASGERARALPQATLKAMADATSDIYDHALSAAVHAVVIGHRPFERARVRDALGYRAWQPPVIEPAAAAGVPEPATRGLVARLARQALAIRHTAVGRALYRVTPQTLLDALKSRLTS